MNVKFDNVIYELKDGENMIGCAACNSQFVHMHDPQNPVDILQCHCGHTNAPPPEKDEKR